MHKIGNNTHDIQVTYVDWLENYAAHPYKMTTIKRYVVMLETVPEKFDISLSKGIMDITDLDEFENAYIAVTFHEEYDQLNKSCNGALSAALAAYRRYLAYINKTSVVCRLRRFRARHSLHVWN